MTISLHVQRPLDGHIHAAALSRGLLATDALMRRRIVQQLDGGKQVGSRRHPPVLDLRENLHKRIKAAHNVKAAILAL